MQLQTAPTKRPRQRRSNDEAAEQLAALVDAYVTANDAMNTASKEREARRDEILAMWRDSPGLIFRSPRYLLAIAIRKVRKYTVEAGTRTVITVARLNNEVHPSMQP